MKIAFLCALLGGLFACGGRVEDPKSGGSAGEDTAPTSSGNNDGAGKSGASGSFPAHELGDCKPGFDRASNPARSCNWLTDSGLCFETNDDACACICPAEENSVCYSPFYNGDGSATLVHCI
ncbi:MAG: hypothetical protein ABJB12_03425 [Pseudomonadota bacterium]